MKKQEALALLKEIVTCKAANPNWLSLAEIEIAQYEICIKGKFNKEVIEEIVKARGLTVNVNNEFMTIH